MENAENNITKEFLENQLKTKVKSFLITSGSNAGDNFTSVLYAIDVTLEKNEEKLYLLMKAFPNHPARHEFLTSGNIFLKEVRVYENYIPAMKTLDMNYKFAFPPYISGKAIDYKSSDTEKTAKIEFLDNYLLMTDLRKTSGFMMADRRKGLNFKHAKMVLIELAKLHACSWIYKTKHNLKNLKEEFIWLKDEQFNNNEMMDKFKPLMENITTTALNHIKDGLGSESPAFIGVKKLSDDADLIERVKLFISPDGIDEEQAESWLRVKPKLDDNYSMEPWLVGCHGDCWINNMLFRYKDDTDREKPEEIILLDLQLYREVCPTTDLAYFLVTSTSYQVRQKHEKEFMEIYYNKFIETCNEFSVKPMNGFTLSTLIRRYRRAKMFGYYMGIPLLQIVLQDPTDAIDLDSFSENKTDMGDIFESVLSSGKHHGLLREQLCGLAMELYEDGVV